MIFLFIFFYSSLLFIFFVFHECVYFCFSRLYKFLFLRHFIFNLFFLFFLLAYFYFIVVDFFVYPLLYPSLRSPRLITDVLCGIKANTHIAEHMHNTTIITDNNNIHKKILVNPIFKALKQENLYN